MSGNVDTKIRIVEIFFRYTYLNGQNKANLSGIFSPTKIPVKTREALFWPEVSENEKETLVWTKILELRTARNISEYKISTDLGFSKGYIQSITSGRSLPSLPALLDICDYFDITLKDFFDEGVEPESPLILKILKNLKGLPEEDMAALVNLTDKYQFCRIQKERMLSRRR